MRSCSSSQPSSPCTSSRYVGGALLHSNTRQAYTAHDRATIPCTPHQATAQGAYQPTDTHAFCSYKHHAQVALLFLTRGPVSTAPIWRTWFTTAALIELHPDTVPPFVTRHGHPPRTPPHQPLLDALLHTVERQQGSTDDAWTLPVPRTNCSDLAAVRDAVDVIAVQALFSVYVHPSTNYTYCEGDLFAAHALPASRRVDVQWAQHTMVDAQRALLAEALMEPRNQRLVMLSDSCVPLYPPQVLVPSCTVVCCVCCAGAVWWGAWRTCTNGAQSPRSAQHAPPVPKVVYLQTLWEQQSRINACKGVDDEGKRGLDRWHDSMAVGRLEKRHWRKSSQWASFTRRHAEVVVQDNEVVHAFRWQCTRVVACMWRWLCGCM